MHCGAFRGHCIIVQWIGGRLCFPILDIESGTSSYQILRNHPMTKQIKSCTVLRFSAVKKREEKSGLEFSLFITGSWVEVRLTGLRCGRRVIPDDSSFRSEFYSLQKSKIMLKNETATASSKAESKQQHMKSDRIRITSRGNFSQHFFLLSVLQFYPSTVQCIII